MDRSTGHSLTAITALGGSAPRVDQVADVTCSEIVDLALASVSARLGQEATCADKLAALLSTPAPSVGRAVLAQPLSAVWIGPDQWMVGADVATHEDIAMHVKAALKDAASVTEQTDAWCGFDLVGDGIQAVMELLCNANLRAMQPGDACRTSIHHLGCFIICGDPRSFVRILGPRASAGSLHHAITTAMRAAL